MNEKVTINIKLAEDDLFKNELVLLRNNSEYYTIKGLSHEKYGSLIYRVNAIFETMSTTELLRKLEINLCKVEINGVIFKL